MKRLPALALFTLLLTAAPALADNDDDLGSEAQTQGYGHIFGIVLLAAAGGIILLGGLYIFKGMLAEVQRGKRTGLFREAILDDLPKRKPRALYLGEKVPDWKVANRLKANGPALKFLARSDNWFDTAYLAKIATGAFKAVKAALEGRTSKKIENRVAPEFLEEIKAEIKRLHKKGELHVFSPVEVDEIAIVHFEAPATSTKQTFTALISAKSRDYFRDDKSGEVLRGDKKYYAYQEFWRFRRTKARWVLERIRPSGDMDTVLGAKNVMTQKDLDKFAKTADEEMLREFVAK
jgi:hypothetical protein